jgi:hypothetical protein
MQCSLRSRVHAFISRPGLHPGLRLVLRTLLRSLATRLASCLATPPSSTDTDCRRLSPSQVVSWPSLASR